MNNQVIETEKLTKVYTSVNKSGGVTALNGVSLKIPRGIIFGLLGPNGAGKTTLVKILLGITKATSGSVHVLGEPPENYSIRKKIGYLPENHKFPEYLNAEQVMKFYGELNGISLDELKPGIDHYLSLVKMLKWKKTKIKKFSKGMLQRLGIAQALIHDPEIVFLDEPTDGVDPLGRKEIRDLLLSLKEKGKTIFINSHLLSEVEMISDRIAILNKGELIFEGEVSDLTSDKNRYEIVASENINDYVESKLTRFKYRKVSDNKIIVDVESEENLNQLIDILRENKIGLKSVSQVKNTLEEKFISLIDSADNN